MLTLITLLNVALASTQTTSTFHLSSGETLSHYAAWSGLSVAEIAQESGLDSSGVYAIGTPIKIAVPSEQAVTITDARDGYRSERFSEWSSEGNMYLEEHPVQSGESAWSIALDNGLDLWQLEAANPDVELKNLRPGQVLMVPTIEEYGC